ncbi:migration and invasion-inhibitory protein-like [Clytia hemisphaerica]
MNMNRQNSRKKATATSTPYVEKRFKVQSGEKKKQQTPKRVCFSKFAKDKEDENDNLKKGKQMDTSMMGYDWIAHMVENESVVHQESDNYFEQINQFRNDHSEQCTLSKGNRRSEMTVSKGLKPTQKRRSTRNRTLIEIENIRSNIPLSCKGNGAYTVDKRCDLIPVHGPYSNCPVCKTKPKFGPECKDECVRVSIPCSRVESPYQLRPHRRRSYDPSESVSLSSHCLTGWKGSKPHIGKFNRQTKGLSLGLSEEIGLCHKKGSDSLDCKRRKKKSWV